MMVNSKLFEVLLVLYNSSIEFLQIKVQVE